VAPDVRSFDLIVCARKELRDAHIFRVAAAAIASQWFDRYRTAEGVSGVAKHCKVFEDIPASAHRFRRAPDIHRVGLESLDSQDSRLLCPIGIDLNSEPMDGYVSKQMTECHAIAYRTDRERRIRLESSANV
jgi:hypothetical protein